MKATHWCTVPRTDEAAGKWQSGGWMTRGRAEIAGGAGDERGNKYNLIADLALMTKIRLWSIGQILLFLKPMDDAFFAKGIVIISTNHILLSFQFHCQSANFHFFKAGAERNTSKEVCLQECFTRRVYYILCIQHITTRSHASTLLVCSFHFSYSTHINLRHTALETCS